MHKNLDTNMLYAIYHIIDYGISTRSTFEEEQSTGLSFIKNIF